MPFLDWQHRKAFLLCVMEKLTLAIRSWQCDGLAET
jgi:hypothetical protein